MKKFIAVFAVFALYLCMAAFTYKEPIFNADNSDAEQDLADNVEEIVDELNLAELEAYLAQLNDEQLALLGGANLKEKIKAAISGNLSNQYGSFLSYIMSSIGMNILSCLPLIVSVILIAVAYNLISSLRGNFASDSVQNIVYFACVSLLLIILFTKIMGAVSTVRKTVESLREQMSIMFPILLTLMTAIGAGSSVAVYRPGVAILASGIAEIITAFILPAFLISIVLTAIGNLTDGVKLNKLSGFFSGSAKWLLGSAFFLFSAVMAVQGITASVYDGVSVRAAKFAISKYVPVIGGYLSDGLNLVISGSVLVKNSVGLTGIVLLFVSVLPIVLQLVTLSLGLRFAGAVIEPFGDGRMSSLVTDLSKNLILLVAIVLAIAFLYFVFLLLIVCTGNLAL